MRTTRTHVGAGAPARPAEQSSAEKFFRNESEGGPPSRQPAGRLRYEVLAALLILAVTARAESFNATRAMQYTREVTAFGARPIGSPTTRSWKITSSPT